jgi:hypothetical protein
MDWKKRLDGKPLHEWPIEALLEGLRAMQVMEILVEDLRHTQRDVHIELIEDRLTPAALAELQRISAMTRAEVERRLLDCQYLN